MFTNMGPAPSGRSGHAMATWQNKVFVLGGESYTSTKHEWPNMVHMLDTGKIKYPSDSRLGNRKSSNSRLNAGLHASGSTNGIGSKAIQQVVTDDQRRAAASPTGSEREASQVNGLKNSFNKSLPNGYAGSPARGAPSPTPRQEPSSNEDQRAPRRPSDASRRAMSPINEQSSLVTATRSLSPTMHNDIAPSSSLQSITTSTSTPPNRSQPTMNGQTYTNPPASVANISALRSNARSPSPVQMHQTQSHDAPAQQDGYQSMSLQRGPSDEMIRLKERERWMQAALAAAAQQGFVLPDRHQDLGDFGIEQASGNRQLVDALLSLKSELSELRVSVHLLVVAKNYQSLLLQQSSMHEEARYADQRIAQANKGRASALQEASFYRSKMAALETNTTGDLYKLERGRIADLERRVAEMGSAKTSLERKVEELDSDLDRQRDIAQTALEREPAHLQRADAAESAYSRSLTDFADLQRRAHTNESSVQEHLGKITSLESQLAQARSQHSHLCSKLTNVEDSLDQHLLALEQTRTNLASAHAHTKEVEGMWNRSKEDLAFHRGRSIELETDLHKLQQQLEAAQSRVEELDRALQISTDEVQSLRDLTSSHLRQLLETSRETKNRDLNDESALHAEQLQAMQQELERHKNLAKEAHSRHGAAQAELRNARLQHSGAEKQVSLLRGELASMRARHASALEASSRAQGQVTQRDLDLREKSRTIEAAEVKAGLLRSLLAENGLIADEKGSPSMGSGESNVVLRRKIAELESRLEQRTQTTLELQNLHDEARREAESSSHGLRMSEEQIDSLRSQMEQMKFANSDNGASAETAMKAERAQNDLAALQDKHQQLETTHMKAVQYVKG